MILTKLDQHVSEMMTTAGKKFLNFWWFCFLIIMQNVNMAANGKRNRRLNPTLAIADIVLFWALKVRSNTIFFTNIRPFCT